MLGKDAKECDLETALTNHIQRFILERHPQDQRSIGILLCKTPNKVIVEYSLQEFASPLGVAEYQIAGAVPVDLRGELPSIEELEQELKGISVDAPTYVVVK